MAIDENPHVEDKKVKQKSGKNNGLGIKYEVEHKPQFNLNEWITSLINNSDEKFALPLLKLHDVVMVNLIKRGTLSEELGADYKNLIIGTLTKKGLGYDTEKHSVTDRVIYHIEKPNRVVGFSYEERPSRKRRKRINFIGVNTLKEIVGEMHKCGYETHEFDVVDENNNKVKTVMINGKIAFILEKIAEASDYSLNDNFCNTIESFYKELLTDISSKNDGHMYTIEKDLNDLLRKIRTGLMYEIDNVYIELYKKIGMPPKKLPSTRKTLSITLATEDKDFERLFILKDSDLNNILQMIDYYKFLNV